MGFGAVIGVFRGRPARRPRAGIPDGALASPLSSPSSSASSSPSSVWALPRSLREVAIGIEGGECSDIALARALVLRVLMICVGVVGEIGPVAVEARPELLEARPVRGDFGVANILPRGINVDES